MKKAQEETKSPAPVKKLSAQQQKKLDLIKNGYDILNKSKIKISADVEKFYKNITTVFDGRKISEVEKKWKLVFIKLGSGENSKAKEILKQLTKRQPKITEFMQPEEKALIQRQFDELSFFQTKSSKRGVPQDQLTQDTYYLDDSEDDDVQKKQGDQTQQQLDEGQQQTEVQQITQRVRSLGARIGRPYDFEELQRVINDTAEQRNLTTEQRAIFVQQTKLENIIKSLSKYGDIIGNVNKNKKTIMILGKEYEQDKIIEGIQKLLADITKISGNVAELNLSSKTAPFKKVLKLQKKEQTQFKPTLNQLFQTRKVMC